VACTQGKTSTAYFLFLNNLMKPASLGSPQELGKFLLVPWRIKTKGSFKGLF
jgi:hypothetical protein